MEEDEDPAGSPAGKQYMIPSRRVFNDFAGDYDRWFEEHGDINKTQIRILRDAVPHVGRGYEVGVWSVLLCIFPLFNNPPAKCLSMDSDEVRRIRS